MTAERLVASAGEWERWLDANHARADGVWLKIAKKGSGVDSVRYPDVLEIALCFGWIDARRQAPGRAPLPAARCGAAARVARAAERPRAG